MIRTERLLLRAPQLSDLDALIPVFSNQRAMAYWSHAAHQTRDQTLRTLENMIKSHQNTGLEFVIERDGQVIGKAGLWRIAELGYILHPDHWQQGIASEALRAIIAQAWLRHGAIAQITAEIDPRNTGSAKLLTGLGFHKTHSAKATIEVNGAWCDSDYFALNRPAPAPNANGPA